ncbi:MAG: hypothetical protein QOH60_4004 [Mycobacterium sp.]|jgi:hypothetical protein|nr:hypothetical protein [Mycobacterium sp.]
MKKLVAVLAVLAVVVLVVRSRRSPEVWHEPPKGP